MSDKLSRAKHRGIDKTSIPEEYRRNLEKLPKPQHMAQENAAYRGIHAGTARLEKISALSVAPLTPDERGFASLSTTLPESKTPTDYPQEIFLEEAELFDEVKEEVKEEDGFDNKAVGTSALLISICTIISRLTGFIRTFAMAGALGATLLSSSYQVANNLPNMVFELVAGGMIATAFLPVYLSIKKKRGADAGNAYASNLLSIVTVFLGIVTAISMLFPSAIIYTQSFWSDQGDMTQSVFFFQFFAIQILLYGIGSIFTGLLNANRDYLWSFAAPIFNNVIVISSFVLYYFLSPQHAEAALYIIAIGNTLGVLVQTAIQIPALRRNGIRFRFRIDFKDPALKETLSIGVPAIIVMASAAVIVSVQIAASYSFADNGPAIINYARLWYLLPYSFLVVPITTTLFTEISDMYTNDNMSGVKKAIVSGTNQIFFFMLPFMLYLIVYAIPLVSLYEIGAFSAESTQATASYLAAFALGLPFYGLNTYLQKVFSSLRILKSFAYINVLATLIQVGLTAGAAMLAMGGIVDLGIESIAYASAIFYLFADIFLFIYLRKRIGHLELSSMLRSFVSSLLIGLLGSGIGGVLFWLLSSFIAESTGNLILSLVYVVICGLVSLATTYGIALKLKLPETAIIKPLLAKVGIGKRS